MRQLLHLFIVISIVLCFLSCEKGDPPSEKNKYNYLIFKEEAFPGESGEIVELMLNGIPITCEIIRGVIVLQGDIILTEEQVEESSLKGAGLSESLIKRWTNNTIIYNINKNVPTKDSIIDAIQHWQNNTSVEFKQWTNETNYVEFVLGDGCSSFLGMIGGKQEIQVADWAVTGNIIHEIGHTYGLIHEHSRSDRDSYITIKEDNIREEDKHNFQIYSQSISTSIFDFGSIMIYSSRNSYAIDPDLPTMTKLDGTEWVAQREKLSIKDIEFIDVLRYGNFTDSRDSHEYKTIKIGDQVWMAENLAYLPSVSGSDMQSNSDPYYYVYGYQGSDLSEATNSTNYKKYGALYNWEASKSACPDGWHLPTDDEWKTLVIYLGGSKFEWDNDLWTLQGKVGKKLKSTYDWLYDGSGDNSSGFNAFPGGALFCPNEPPNLFYYINEFAYFWSSTPWLDTHAWSTTLFYGDAGVYHLRRLRHEGYSIRCIKD